MKLPARILGFFLAFFLIFFISKVSFAQTYNYTNQENNLPNQYVMPDTNPDVPKNLHTLSQSLLIDFMSSITCQLAGIDPISPNHKCLGIDRNTGKIGFVENGGGVIGIMGSAITMLYTPPVHTADYFRYLAGNFGISKDAYAQTGVGLNSLGPVAGLWQTFRNIVYLLFVLIFVFIGLGIMLRVKIDPRTVMTIQNQIPKLIIALILVTFSLAIAGFLIDLMWVLIIVIVNVLASADSQLLAAIKPGSYITTFSMSDVVGGFFGIARGTSVVVGNGLFQTFNGNNVTQAVPLPATTTTSCTDLLCWIGLGISGTFIGPAINAIFGLLISFVVGAFVFLVVIIAVIWALFKLWFALLSAYISILIDIIFAPFWIIGGFLPNAEGGAKSIGFGAWLRDLAGNLMAFPVTIGMFLIGKVFLDGFAGGYSGLFTPPLIGKTAEGGIGNFGAVIAFGIIMMLPNVVKMTKAAFKAPSFETRSLQEGLGVGQAVALAGTSRFWKGMARPAGNGYSAGPLRVGVAKLLSTTRNETTIHKNANKVVGRWYNLGGRLNRHRIASSLIGKQQEPSVKSSEAGGTTNQS